MSAAELPTEQPTTPLDPALERLRELVRHAYASETLRSYRAGWAQWADWCGAAGISPVCGNAEQVSLFLAALSQRCRLATVKARLAAIVAAHRAADVAFDAAHPLIAAALRGLARESSHIPIRQAPPILLDHLPALLAAWDPATPTGARNRAVLLLGFGAALRRSELVGLDLADIDLQPEGLRLEVRRSKTDQDGIGAMVGIHRNPDRTLCAAAAAETWLGFRGQVDGPFFTRLRKGERLCSERLSAQSVGLSSGKVPSGRVSGRWNSPATPCAPGLQPPLPWLAPGSAR